MVCYGLVRHSESITIFLTPIDVLMFQFDLDGDLEGHSFCRQFNRF